MSREKLAYIFSSIIVIAWIAVLGTSLVTHDYTGVTILTPVLMMVGGYILGYGPKGGPPNA